MCKSGGKCIFILCSGKKFSEDDENDGEDTVTVAIIDLEMLRSVDGVVVLKRKGVIVGKM